MNVSKFFFKGDKKFPISSKTTIEEENKIAEIKNKKFNVDNYEVDPRLFDPNNKFKPILSQRKGIEIP